MNKLPPWMNSLSPPPPKKRVKRQSRDSNRNEITSDISWGFIEQRRTPIARFESRQRNIWLTSGFTEQWPLPIAQFEPMEFGQCIQQCFDSELWDFARLSFRNACVCIWKTKTLKSTFTPPFSSWSLWKDANKTGLATPLWRCCQTRSVSAPPPYWGSKPGRELGTSHMTAKFLTINFAKFPNF